MERVYCRRPRYWADDRIGVTWMGHYRETILLV